MMRWIFCRVLKTCQTHRSSIYSKSYCIPKCGLTTALQKNFCMVNHSPIVFAKVASTTQLATHDGMYWSPLEFITANRITPPIFKNRTPKLLFKIRNMRTKVNFTAYQQIRLDSHCGIHYRYAATC